MPELVLTTAGCPSMNPHQTSCSSKIVRRYQFLLSTGDFRLHLRLYPVEWALYCALIGWKEVLAELEWDSYRFVKKAEFVNVDEGFSDSAKNRKIEGWSATWTCDVEMHFPTASLINFNQGSSSSSGD